MSVALICCRPTTYTPGGALVHSPVCSMSPEHPLTRVEFHEWRRRNIAASEAAAQASASGHPTAPDTPWWLLHDIENPTGCGNSGCFRCRPRQDEVWESVL